MFDFDIGKIVLVASVALIVVGPKELPQMLRALGRAIAKVRALQAKMKTAANDFIAEADLDGIGQEFTSVKQAVWANIALDPATVMRGGLPFSSGGDALPAAPELDALCYASPEMEAYLGSPSEPASPAPVGEPHGNHTARPSAVLS